MKGGGSLNLRRYRRKPVDGSRRSTIMTSVSELSEQRARAREQVPLAALMAETVDLKPAQSNLRGACPFHPDATRGLYVSPSGNFHCFSCGAGGDVVAWTMKVHLIDEAAAIIRLLRR